MVLDKDLDRDELMQRLEFVRFYARWVKSTPNEVWSEQQAVLVNSMVKSSRNFLISPEKYLKMKERCRMRVHSL